MTLAHNRIEVMHGVNLDQLGRRDPAVYGTLTLTELERRVEQRAEALGLRTTFFHSNHEGEFVERLHALREEVDAILLNPGAWTQLTRGRSTTPWRSPRCRPSRSTCPTCRRVSRGGGRR